MALAPLGRQVNLYAQFQAAFATQPTTGTWKPLTVYSNALTEAQPLEDDPTLGRALHNGRDPNEPAPGLPSMGGAIEVPCCLRELGFWLKATFGAPVTTDGEVEDEDYVHTFKSGNMTIPPLALQKLLKTGDWRRALGVKVNTFAWKAEKVGGFPRISLGCLGRSEALASAAAGGTLGDPFDLLRPPAALASVLWDGVVIGALQMGDGTYTNNLAPRMDLDGSLYCADLDPGPALANGNWTMRYQDQTFEAIARARTKGALAFRWALPADPSNRVLTIELPEATLSCQGTPIAGPDAMVQAFTYSVEQTVSEAAVVVTLKNDVASY